MGWAHGLARQLGLWLLYLACFDFFYYWLHRAQHQIPWLWRYYMVHHSDVNVSASSVGRPHWLEAGFRFFVITAPLILIMGGGEGSPSWVLAFIVLNGVFMHWNVSQRFGPLERCVITPLTIACTTPLRRGTTTPTSEASPNCGTVYWAHACCPARATTQKPASRTSPVCAVGHC